jgi:hypothetical protein
MIISVRATLQSELKELNTCKGKPKSDWHKSVQEEYYLAREKTLRNSPQGRTICI